MQIITLTTDFGNKDWFAGTVKGVILSICPTAQIVDITHDLDSFNIKAGAFIIKNAYRYFPKNTIHCIIVDPAVGSLRNIIALKTKDYFFLTPDNGIMSHITAQEKVEELYKITNKTYMLNTVSSTFHGRDIFAPIAAHLAQGTPLAELGKPIKKMRTFSLPSASFGKGKIKGEIIFIDKFGNIILNIPILKFKKINCNNQYNGLHLKIQNVVYKLRFVEAYYQGKTGELILVPGSSGYLELAMNQGSAQRFLGARYSEKLEINYTNL